MVSEEWFEFYNEVIEDFTHNFDYRITHIRVILGTIDSYSTVEIDNLSQMALGFEDNNTLEEQYIKIMYKNHANGELHAVLAKKPWFDMQLKRIENRSMPLWAIVVSIDDTRNRLFDEDSKLRFFDLLLGFVPYEEDIETITDYIPDKTKISNNILFEEFRIFNPEVSKNEMMKELESFGDDDELPDYVYEKHIEVVRKTLVQTIIDKGYKLELESQNKEM